MDSDSGVAMEANDRARHRRNHERHQREHQESDDDDDDEDLGIIEALRTSFFFQLVKCLIEELFPCLLTPDFFVNCLILAKTSLRENPCACFLYVFLVVFGFLPVLSFFLFVCGTFIISAVCFIICQGIAVTVGALVFGGFFVFIVIMCCAMAMVFGFAIHILCLWGWTSDVLAEGVVNIFSNLKKYLRKFVPYKGPWMRRWMPDDSDGDRL